MLKINNPVEGGTNGHIFLKADLSYSTYVYDRHGVKPEGTIVFKAGGTEKTCDFDLDAGTFTVHGDSTKSCGTLSEDEGMIRFVVWDLDFPKTSRTVTVQFKKSGEGSLYEDSEITEAEIVTEERPTVKFIETITDTGVETGAEKTSASTADLVFMIEGTGDLTKAYNVYNLVQLGSKSDAEGAVWSTCTFDNKTYHWTDSSCSGELTVSGNRYTIRNFTGIISLEDTKASATLVSQNTDITEAEYPADTADYWHKKIATTLTITDPLKYKGPSSAYAFVAFDINFDESERAKWGDIYPSGWIKFSSTNDEGDLNSVCYINLKTGETDQCDDVIKTPQWWTEHGETSDVLLNVRVWPTETKVSLEFNGDDYFEPSSAAEYVPYTQEAPEIEIHNAVHTSDGKVYADFTITGMGALSEKYLVNQSLRFGSKNGGKTCTYNLTNQEFNEGCEGTLDVSGDTFTLKGLTNLYTAEDTEFSVTLVTNEDYNHPESEYVHKEKAYGKLPTSIGLDKVLKVMGSHGFVTVDFGYEAEISGRYGVSPTGMLTFSSSAGSCTYNLNTKTADGCVVVWDESASSAGNIHLLAKNMPVSNGVTQVTVSYSENDDFFIENTGQRRVDVDSHPVINITEAYRNSLTKGRVEFDVSSVGVDVYADVYGSFFDQISIRSNTSRASYINISNIMESGETSGTASLINGTGSVNWSKDGNTYTFKVENWSGPILAGDARCGAELISHAYLAEAEYPEDWEDFLHGTGSTEFILSDVYAAKGTHVYLTAELAYDEDIADSFNVVPTGTVTITAADSGAAEKVCRFDLDAGTFTLKSDSTKSCGTVELDRENHKAIFVVRNYEPGRGITVSAVRMKYNGDDSEDVYFNASEYASADAVIEDPEITIEYPIMTRESDNSAHGYVAFTINGIGEGSYPEMYNIYPRIRLISRSSSDRRYCYLERATLSFTSDCLADEITLSGNQYVIKNLRGRMVDGSNFIHSNDNYVGVALFPYGEGWTGETSSSYPVNEVYWWWRITTYGEVTDVIKYSRDHAAFTTTLSLSERGQAAADFWGMSPAMASGSMEFKAGSATCTVDLATETFTGCEGEVEVTGNAPVTIKVRNLRATDLGPSLLIAEYRPNRFFDHWQQQYVTFRENIPAVTIDSATKTAHTKANVTVTVNGNEYAEIYGPLYDRIRLAAHNGAYTEIDISGILAGSEASGTITGTSGFEEVNWTRNGNNVTFNVTGWKENITADDKQCTAWLGNSDVSVLPIDHSPKSAPKDFDIQKGTITLTKKNDGLRAINDNAYLDVVLDYDPDTAAAFRKPYGKVTFMAQDSALHKWIKTCTYDLNYLGDLVCDEGGSGSATVIEKDDDNHNATIRLKSFHIYNADSIYVYTTDDNFYTDSNGNIPVTREIPTITVSAPVKRTDSRGYTKGWVEFTIKSGPLTEYYQPYSRIELHSIPSSGTDAVVGIYFPGTPYFDDVLVTGNIDMQYDADTYTYSYVIKNLENLVRSNDARMRADLCSDAAGAVRSNESGFVKISSTINLQDLLVVVDANQKNYAFGKMVYRFADPAKIYDLWPTFYMNVRANWPEGVRFGHIDVETGALGTDARNSFGNAVFTPERAEDTHTLQITMVDVNVHEDTSQVAVYYNDGSNGYPVDDAFQESTTGSVIPTVATPGISITRAFKHPLSVGGSIVPAADISFTLTGYDDLLDTWGVYRAIELRSKLGNTSGVCQINLPWDPEHPSTTCSGTVTKEGNTFSIKDWRGFTSSSDSSVEVALVSKYSDIAGARNEKDYEKTGLELRISDALLMDSKYRFMKVTLTPENPEYSFALSDIWISTGDDGCKYSISTGENFCDCRIDKTESGGSVQLSVEGWERPANGSSYGYKATYLEDNYFNYALAQQTSVMVSLPTVEITNMDVANKTVDIKLDRYTDYYGKYSIIKLVGLRSFQPGNSSTTNFEPSMTPDGETTPSLVGNMMITRNGDAFHVANLPYVRGYTSMMVYLNSVPYNTGSRYRWYWDDESIHADVRLTTGFSSPAPSNSTSGAPVSISVGDFQPIGGE